MTTIHPDTTLAELVTVRPELAARLDAMGLDYCCGGQRSLTEAVATAGLDITQITTELEATPQATESEADWEGVDGLVDHLETTHHAYLRESLPRLDALADKVAGVHGQNHPELLEVAEMVRAIRADLEPHLLKEEQMLFPMIRELANAKTVPAFHCGSISNPIRVMLGEHDAVGDLLARIRACTDSYQVPADGCASYTALYAGLSELEADTHVHVHKENNLLFPAVLDLEGTLAGSTA